LEIQKIAKLTGVYKHAAEMVKEYLAYHLIDIVQDAQSEVNVASLEKTSDNKFKPLFICYDACSAGFFIAISFLVLTIPI
jgi:uncharacterized protein YihD (DUF1040 family)